MGGVAMALLEITCVPVGTGSPSISSHVAEACKVAARDGVRYQVTPTSTVLEGDLDEVLSVARRMHEAAFRAGCTRVVSLITIDERRDRPLRMERAVETVEQQVAH